MSTTLHHFGALFGRGLRTPTSWADCACPSRLSKASTRLIFKIVLSAIGGQAMLGAADRLAVIRTGDGHSLDGDVRFSVMANRVLAHLDLRGFSPANSAGPTPSVFPPDRRAAWLLECTPMTTLAPFVHRINGDQLRSLIDDSHLPMRLFAHRAILVRGVEPSDQLLAAVAVCLGTPQPAFPAKSRVVGCPSIKRQLAGFITNYDAAYWHQDRNFGTTPATATVLQCHEAPARGGETSLLDGTATIGALGEVTKRALRSWRGIYEFQDVKQRYAEPMDLLRLVDYEESVILTHPVTGRESIALSERYVRFEDEQNSVDPGCTRLQTICRIIGEGAVYVHSWQVGDILIWDNFATLHRGNSVPDDASKVTHRVVVM